eukprot:gb/GECH01011219.1/.p1 GENE.gb/GECH01011219.1/~~gb/GECH01011219.1/.p1  ORF type:complete len:427 (+),score=82.24 gb/GECH01011219.1/:1-1281(+)
MDKTQTNNTKNDNNKDIKDYVDYMSIYPSALEFKVKSTWEHRARVSKLKLPHFECDTPMFMPVGTQGTVKGLTSQQLQELDCHVILGNTYHLGQRPGAELLDEMGGLHKFMNWPRGMLTDSGGFQMVSLLDLADINEEGVRFQSPHDGSEMMLTPEHSMDIQNKIGADIMMALDDVVSSTVTGPRVEEATYRTLRWMDRCIKAHKRPQEQNLFAIVQGGLDPRLRDICLQGLIKRNTPGYAIGGLSGGEDKNNFWPIVKQCCESLPFDKPRYVMGVGYPVDLVICSGFGADMFDCVYPTRTARFGTALIDCLDGSVQGGTINLRSNEFRNDTRPLDEECSCSVCSNYSRAYIHSVVKEGIGSQLLTYHNIAYQMRLMRKIRAAIRENRYPDFVRTFMKQQFPDEQYPQWAVDALNSIDISLIKNNL